MTFQISTFSTKKISVFKNLSNYKLSKGFKVKKILIQHNIQNIVILARTPKYIYVKKYTLSNVIRNEEKILKYWTRKRF